MELDSTMSEHITFRLFPEEKKKLDQIVDKKQDSLGGKKFENRGHACRVAVIRLIREEL